MYFERVKQVEEILLRFVQRIRELRKKRGFLQEAFAAEFGVDTASVVGHGELSSRVGTNGVYYTFRVSVLLGHPDVAVA